MTQVEKIIVSLIVHATPTSTDWHQILYQIMLDLGVENLGQLQAGVYDHSLISSQQLYPEYCLGCKRLTGQLSLECVAYCTSCSPSERTQGLYIQYFLHFLFALETEGPARRALYQELYRSRVIGGLGDGL